MVSTTPARSYAYQYLDFWDGGSRGPTRNLHGSKPSTLASTSSPTARGATPEGVPVNKMSPASNVKSCGGNTAVSYQQEGGGGQARTVCAKAKKANIQSQQC